MNGNLIEKWGAKIAQFTGRKNNKEIVTDQTTASSFLRDGLEKFKYKWQEAGGSKNKWEIWPVSGGEANIEQLKLILQNIISQFPESNDTYIGRSFPQGSYVELRNPQGPGEGRTLTEFGYIPLPETESINTHGNKFTPVLQIEFKRQGGIHSLQEQAKKLIGDSAAVYNAALAENISLSFIMGNQGEIAVIEKEVEEASHPFRISLNSPDIINFSQRQLPPNASTSSDLQLLLKTASESVKDKT